MHQINNPESKNNLHEKHGNNLQEQIILLPGVLDKELPINIKYEIIKNIINNFSHF